MYRSLPGSTDPVSPASTPSWKAIAIAWMALVIGPVAVLILLANPVIGVGTAVGMGLLILVRRVGLVDHTPDSPGESANASRVADVHRGRLASKSD